MYNKKNNNKTNPENNGELREQLFPNGEPSPEEFLKEIVLYIRQRMAINDKPVETKRKKGDTIEWTW